MARKDGARQQFARAAKKLQCKLEFFLRQTDAVAPELDLSDRQIELIDTESLSSGTRRLRGCPTQQGIDTCDEHLYLQWLFQIIIHTGIEQVNTAVSQMDQVTQQNAALVEEAAAATQSLAQQAQELREAVAVFRIADMWPSASRVVAPRSEPRRPAPTVRTPPRATSTRASPVTTADRNDTVAKDGGATNWQAF